MPAWRRGLVDLVDDEEDIEVDIKAGLDVAKTMIRFFFFLFFLGYQRKN